MGLDYRCVHPDGSQADVRDENGHYVVTIDGEQVFADRRQELATAASFTGVVPLASYRWWWQAATRLPTVQAAPPADQKPGPPSHDFPEAWFAMPWHA